MSSSGFLRHITTCNAWNLGGLRPLTLNGACIGWPAAPAQQIMASLPRDFVQIDQDWCFTSTCSTFALRSAALHRVAQQLAASGAIRPLTGEPYRVTVEWGQAPVAEVDRAASVALGIRAFGVHLNGFVRRPDGLHMWISKRTAHKSVAPGKLDNMVAGGQPAHLNLQDNLVKECAEEASLPTSLAHTAQPVSMVRYCFRIAEGLKPDTLFCYDLEMPPHVIPTPNDDECERFDLLPISSVLDRIATTDDFKFNVPLVILDFAVRHGVLTADSCPDYAEIATRLRQPFPSPAHWGGDGLAESRMLGAPD